jgi:hypothetical protein
MIQGRGSVTGIEAAAQQVSDLLLNMNLGIAFCLGSSELMFIC